MALQRAAARVGRTVNYRVVVSNFDAAFRVVAADLAISVIPAQVSSPHVESGLVKLIPLSDTWARRRFAICYRKVEDLQAAGRRIVDYLASRAGQQAVPDDRSPDRTTMSPLPATRRRSADRHET